MFNTLALSRANGRQKYLISGFIVLILILSIFVSTAAAAVEDSGAELSSRGTRAKQLHITGGADIAPMFYNVSDVNVGMLYVSIWNDFNNAIDLTSVAVTHTGTGSTADITSVGIYLDDNDLIYEPGTGDTLLASSGSWTGGKVTLTFTRTIAKQTTENYFISYTFSGTASGTHGASLAVLSDFTATETITDPAPADLPISSYNIQKWIVPNLVINATSIFKGAVPATQFFSGESVLIKATMSHTWGAVGVLMANITITDPSSGQVVSDQPMILDGSGIGWKRYRYTYNLPIPAELGLYTVNITGYGKGSNDYIDITFSVLNKAPTILGSVGPFITIEDGSIPVKDLTTQESDLEDSGTNLIWSVSGHNTSMVGISVTDNNLTFTVVPNSFGDTQVNLTLTDSDSGIDWLLFWVNVTGVNDNPWISPRVPDQEKPEDSSDWTLALSFYEHDWEDGSPSTNLIWQVSGVDPPLESSKVFVDSSDVLHFGVQPNGFGSEQITLNLTDSASVSVFQDIYVNITPVNDPPMLSPILNHLMSSEMEQDVYNLPDNVLDIDSTVLEFKIESSTDITFNLTIDANDKLDVEVPQNYIGFTQVNLSVTDDFNAKAYTEFNITASFGLLETELVSPSDKAKLSTNSRQLLWDVNNPGNLANVVFDIYFGTNKNLVEIFNPDSRLVEDFELNMYNVDSLVNGSTYYWTVIPRAPEVNFLGTCTSGIWEFSLDVNMINEPPVAELITPWPNATVKSTTVMLRWLGHDPNGDYPLFYDVYLAKKKDRELVENLDSSVLLADGKGITDRSLTITDLEEDSVYYWTVVPSDGELSGSNPNGTWYFTVNSENYLPAVTLLLPGNAELVGTNVNLFWTYTDLDLFDSVTFEVFLDKDPLKVENLISDSRKTVDNYSEQFYETGPLDNGETYYWWVIPYDISLAAGTCSSGIWSFTVNASIQNTKPVVILETPRDGADIYTSYIDLIWQGQDSDEDDVLSYKIYFSTDRAKVENLDSSLDIIETDLEVHQMVNLVNGTYYWTVIPNDGEADGICISLEWSFNVIIKDNGGGPNGNGNGGDGDTDSDGMPNEWEKFYGFDPNDPSDADNDFDDDGYTNLEEFDAKTDPTDHNSTPSKGGGNGGGNGAIIALAVIGIIIVFIVLFSFINRRHQARRRAERALSEGAELVNEANSVTGPYGGGLDTKIALDPESPYKEVDEAGRVEAVDDEADFPIEKGYRPPVKEPASVKAPTPTPIPSPKAVPGAAVLAAAVSGDASGKAAVIESYVKYLKIDRELAVALYGAGFVSHAKLQKASMDDLLEVKSLNLSKASSLKVNISNLPPAALKEAPAGKPVPVVTATAVPAVAKPAVAEPAGASASPVPVPAPIPVRKPAAVVPAPTAVAPKPAAVPTPVPAPAVAAPTVESADASESDRVCSACGFPLENDDDICPICETPLK